MSHAELTHEQARALRYMSGVEGIVRADAAVAASIRALISTEFAYVGVSEAGYRALARYDQEYAEEATRARIAKGMSSAGRRMSAKLALLTQEESNAR